jgi:ribosomal protein S18 acetylase RimI-like enzyme
VTGRFRIVPLEKQDRSNFESGNEDLDRYLREQASQDIRRWIANCFVAVDADGGNICGYYTLAATSIPLPDLPESTRKRLPRYPVLPAALIGRLAVAKSFQNRGLGGALLANAARRVLASDLTAFALLVEAKDEGAAAFYRHHGFVALLHRPLACFLPLETFRKAASTVKADSLP